MDDLSFDDLLSKELKVESTMKEDSTFGVAQTVEGERQMQSNDLIRQRLMETIKSKTLESQQQLESENVVHNSQFTLTGNQGAIEEVDVDDFASSLDAELSGLMREKNSQLVKSMDLMKDNPNIDRTSLSEYILVEGPYSSLFSEFIMNDKAVPKGTIPLCINMKDNIIFIKEIQATPDILFRLKYFLEGFTFSHVIDGVKSELNIYHYLGKLPILEG